MELKSLITLIDGIQHTTEKPVVLESKNALSQYMDIIAEEHEMDEKIGFHHTGRKSSLAKDLKRTHGLKKSVRRTSRHGAKHFLKDESNPTDNVTLDIPLLIRLLEYAREDANTDMDLHSITEKMIELSANGDSLTMDQYDAIVDNQEQLPSE